MRLTGTVANLTARSVGEATVTVTVTVTVLYYGETLRSTPL